MHPFFFSAAWEARAIPGALQSLPGIADLADHAQRRKIWEKGMNPAAVKEYEPLIIKRVLQLCDELRRQAPGGSVNLAKMLSFFASVISIL